MAILDPVRGIATLYPTSILRAVVNGNWDTLAGRRRGAPTGDAPCGEAYKSRVGLEAEGK
jgi:hypothetical protein